ncbi:MAG TPA: DNA translocase FtsK 4TM domain-containing protein [Acidimicrobiia bacterium]|nr:DNA translocase FtsK 4TM domain-containing protein [Acidimicrobiia bacterium]
MPTRTSTRKGSGRRRVSSKHKKPVAKKARSSRQKKTFIGMLAAMRDSIRNTLGRQTDDVWGMILVVAAILVTLAFFELAGPVGDGFDDGSSFLFGVWRYVVPISLAGVGLALIIGKPREGARRLVVGGLVTFIGTLALFHLLTGAIAFRSSVDLVQERGGAVGSLIAFPLRRILGHWGAFVVLASAIGMGVLLMTQTSVRELFQGIADIWRRTRRLAREVFGPDPESRGAHIARPIPVVEQGPRGKHQKPAEQRPPKQPVAKPEPVHRPAEPEPVVATIDLTGSDYELPPVALLDVGTGGEVNKRSLEETARQLEDTLLQHGVDATLTKIVPGPTVTRYEIELAPGVKVNRVSNLSHDIAYALATPDVRLLVPIPGKSAIGVEVPNTKRRLVSLGDILRSQEAAKPAHPLTVGLGMDISGAARFLNLAELPHVLIAGATGAGKSSCINSIVTSILMRTHPDDVRLIMVDPKRVELGQYNGVPHLLTRVITNPKKANEALKWAVAEMDRRYDLLADAKVRDIEGYREKLDAGGLDPDGFDRFPYIVVLIDELNDLMMVAGKEVEESIVRIAQMARAVGIHLVIATQRPSVDVITGVIKANVPSRLAFSVASQTDSRVIIDGAGAEKLIGMGDMLVVTAKEPRPQRIQGAWVRETEVHAVVEWVRSQREAQYQDKQVLEVAAAAAAAAAAEPEDDDDAELIREAMDLVVRSQLGSTSMLQRKLRIGFARAGRVMDGLEQRGVVGPSVGSKARDVLMTVEELDEILAAESTSV